MTRTRMAIGVEYDGGNYHGWQAQPDSPSVQDAVNQALSRVADHDVQCVGAGRTDAGVHAIEQVAHFDTSAWRSSRAWLLGANTYLPDDINLLWAQPVTADFHARHTATSRSYAYLVLNRAVRSALERDRAWLIRDPLDAGAMHQAAQALLGEHDFSSFRAADCQANSPLRKIDSIQVRREGDRVRITCRANSFLKRMVRNIAGALSLVGRGRQPPGWVAAILAARRRAAGGPAAPAQGLYLCRIDYPDTALPARRRARAPKAAPLPENM